MFSNKLIFYCIFASGLYLMIISMLLYYLEKKFNLSKGIDPELLEKMNVSWTAMNFLMESLFIVVIPTITYGFFYLVVPLSGIRAGLGAALFAFILGAAPALMILSIRVKLPMQFMLFQLISHLLKLGGSLAIISYLYSL